MTGQITFGFGSPARLSGSDQDKIHQSSLEALRSGDEDVALARLDAAQLRRWNDPRLWQVKGLLHRQAGDLVDAVVALEEAVCLAPSDPLIAHGLARTRLEGGLPSVDAFRAALLLAPGDSDMLLGLVAGLAAEEGNAAAAAELEQLLARNPGWLPGHDALCRLRWQAGDKERFARTLEDAVAAYPRDLNLWRLLVIILSQAELNQRLLETVLHGRAAAGEHLLFTANEAVARAELGQFEAADRLFDRLREVGDPSLRMRWVRHLLRSGRPAEAAEKALAMTATPAALQFWPYLSVAWRLLGDPRWEWLEGDPRLIGVYDIGEDLLSLTALADRLRRLHTNAAQPLEQSVRGGTQTEGPLLSRAEPEIRALRHAVTAAVRRHLDQLPAPDPAHPTLGSPRGGKIRFSGSWSVRLAASGFHSNHIHPHGWFSSALYLALPGEDQRGPSPAGWLALGVPQADLGVDLPATREIEPRLGRLVLFPSTMWHGTYPFGAGERLTCAFDVARPS